MSESNTNLNDQPPPDDPTASESTTILNDTFPAVEWGMSVPSTTFTDLPVPVGPKMSESSAIFNVSPTPVRPNLSEPTKIFSDSPAPSRSSMSESIVIFHDTSTPVVLQMSDPTPIHNPPPIEPNISEATTTFTDVPERIGSNVSESTAIRNEIEIETPAEPKPKPGTPPVEPKISEPTTPFAVTPKTVEPKISEPTTPFAVTPKTVEPNLSKSTTTLIDTPPAGGPVEMGKPPRARRKRLYGRGRQDHGTKTLLDGLSNSRRPQGHKSQTKEQLIHDKHYTSPPVWPKMSEPTFTTFTNTRTLIRPNVSESTKIFADTFVPVGPNMSEPITIFTDTSTTVARAPNVSELSTIINDTPPVVGREPVELAKPTRGGRMMVYVRNGKGQDHGDKPQLDEFWNNLQGHRSHAKEQEVEPKVSESTTTLTDTPTLVGPKMSEPTAAFTGTTAPVGPNVSESTTTTILNDTPQAVGPVEMTKPHGAQRKGSYGYNHKFEGHNHKFESHNHKFQGHSTKPELEGILNIPKGGHSMKAQEQQYISNHRSQMTTLQHKIQYLKLNEASELAEGKGQHDVAKLERNKAIQLAHESKLNELQSQLNVYEGLKRRILSNPTLQHPSQITALLHRELYRFQGQLPIFSKRFEIESHMENHTSSDTSDTSSGTSSRFLIIQGQTGSGKSTQLPQYFADHPKFCNQKIMCTQPRKIAAISLAKRVGFEYSCGNNEGMNNREVGYRVSGQKSSDARIEFITEGKMLENIISGKMDPFQNVGVIILDEAHERSLSCDLLLGCFKLPDPRWNHIKIVVTSATIDLDQFSNFFNQAPTITVHGRMFPVSVNYIPNPGFGIGDNTAGIIRASVSCTLDIHMTQGQVPGDILCFLPGQADVLGAKQMFEKQYQQALDKIRKGQPAQKGGDKVMADFPKLKPDDYTSLGQAPNHPEGEVNSLEPCQGHAQNNYEQDMNFLEPCVLPLYGKLEAEQQERIFEFMGPHIRKIIFATDIAETSVTIDGVVHVVDAGVKKGISYDSKRKISSLQIMQISKSSAIQRMGRAGRTKPGECYRLYGPDDFETMEFGTTPEVLQRPLALAVLILRKLRMDPSTFPWISKPPIEALKSAEEELILLGALTKGDDNDELNLTELGHVISNVQQEPSLVKMIHYGSQHGFGNAAVTLASIFPVANNFFWHGIDEESKTKGNKKKKDFALAEGDAVSLYRVYEEWLRISNEPKSGKTAGKWCQENHVNGKAMKIIMTSVSELTPYFRITTGWRGMAQDGKPSNEELARITFAGLFLNTAHIVKTRNSYGKLQYFSLHTGVLGNCSRGSSLTYQPDPPNWIVYDRVLQVPVTLLLTCNQILPEWIQAENPEFYNSCLAKREELPTSLVKCLSPEVISSLLGKFYSNVQILQNELDSSIESDLESGRLTLYCARNKIHQVQYVLDRKIKMAVTHLEEKLIELDYLGGCRLLIGRGYQIKDVLFSNDFITLYVRNLPPGVTEQDLRRKIFNEIVTSRDTRIHQIQLFQRSGNGLITFYSKDSASEFHRACSTREIQIQGQRITTNPSMGRKKGISIEITGKLKFSWSTAQSKQLAKIWFHSGNEANRFIENAGSFLQGAVIRGVGTKEGHSKNRTHTPTLRINAPKGYPMPARFRFDLDKILDMSEDDQAKMEYTVSVNSIPLSMDEYGIKEALRHFKIDRVRVERHTEPDDAKERENLTERLLPIAEWMKTVPNYPFTDPEARRKGVWLNFTRLGLLRDAYREIVSSAPWREMQKPYGQSPRLEIEYFYTATILRDLYQIFEADIQKIVDYARSLKIWVMNSGNQDPKRKNYGQATSKFVFVKFQSQVQKHFPDIQKKMEAVTACTKFESEDAHVLFTRTGKQTLAKFQFGKYLNTSFHSQGIWIYGAEALRARIVERLNEIVKRLKSLDFLDFEIGINKKVVRNDRDRVKIQRELDRIKGLEFRDIVGWKVIVSGRTADIENLKRILEDKQLIFKAYKKISAGRNVEECGVCLTEPDGKYVITTACSNNVKCGRIFCLECIQPMFDQVPPPYPLKCPTCESDLVIDDILKWASSGSLRRVMETAVADYRNKNSESIVSCPKPGCEQLIQSTSIIKGFYDGEFVFCDECVTSYCLICSKKLEKAITIHEDESCEDIQSGSSNRARIHVNTIREIILTLQCPRCKTAYIDYEGCAALTCGVATCACAFCALCLEDCGSDSHAHVMKCRYNTVKNFYVSHKLVDEIHKTIRIDKIRKYLKDVTYEEQEFILKMMCKDFMDLGIEVSDVQLEKVKTQNLRDVPAPEQEAPPQAQNGVQQRREVEAENRLERQAVEAENRLERQAVEAEAENRLERQARNELREAQAQRRLAILLEDNHARLLEQRRRQAQVRVEPLPELRPQRRGIQAEPVRVPQLQHRIQAIPEYPQRHEIVGQPQLRIGLPEPQNVRQNVRRRKDGCMIL